MEPVQVEFTYSAQSFTQLRRLMFWRFFSTGWVKWIYLTVIALWIAKLMIRHEISSFLISLTAIGAMVVLWVLIFNWMSKRTFRQTPALQHPIRYVFTPEDIKLNTQNAEAVLQWSTFQRAEELTQFFLLFQNRATANPVMKPGFASAADMERFRAMLRDKGLLK